jgi:hypothetical protein
MRNTSVPTKEGFQFKKVFAVLVIPKKLRVANKFPHK